MAGGVSLPLVFGAILAGAVIIDYGVKNARAAFASSPSASSSAGVSVGPGQYVAPLDPKAASVGRTDQGVDVSAPAGTPIRAIGNSKVMGILQNWYSGQPYVWFQFLDGSRAGQYWYVAEQINPSVRAGELVHAGDPVGTVASSGTGLELGFATQAGDTLAHATTGYVEGTATAAGQQFSAFLKGLGL